MTDFSYVTSTTNTDSSPQLSFEVEDVWKVNMEDAGNVNIGDAGNVNIGDAGKIKVEDSGNVNIEDAGKEDMESAGKVKQEVFDIEAEKKQSHGRSFFRKWLCFFLFLSVVCCIIGVVIYFTVFKPPKQLASHTGNNSASLIELEIEMQVTEPDKTNKGLASLVIDFMVQSHILVLDGKSSDVLCPQNWTLHDGKCYLFSQFPVHASDSKEYCAMEGGVPFASTIVTENLQAFLTSRIRLLIGCCLNGKRYNMSSAVENIDKEIEEQTGEWVTSIIENTEDSKEVPLASSINKEEKELKAEDQQVLSIAFEKESTTMPNLEHGFWLGAGHHKSHHHGDAWAVPEGFAHDADLWTLPENSGDDVDIPMSHEDFISEADMTPLQSSDQNGHSSSSKGEFNHTGHTLVLPKDSNEVSTLNQFPLLMSLNESSNASSLFFSPDFTSSSNGLGKEPLTGSFDNPKPPSKFYQQPPSLMEAIITQPSRTLEHGKVLSSARSEQAHSQDSTTPHGIQIHSRPAGLDVFCQNYDEFLIDWVEADCKGKLVQVCERDPISVGSSMGILGNENIQLTSEKPVESRLSHIFKLEFHPATASSSNSRSGTDE